MAFIPEIECESLQSQEQYQFRRLQQLLAYLQRHSAFYQKKLSESGINSSKLRGLQDLYLLPTTSKEDLQSVNASFLCVPQNRVREYMCTSGSLGKAVNIALSQSDLDRLAYNEYLSFLSMGTTQDDIVQLLLTLDKQFMAGMAYYRGLEKTGAAVVRTGPGHPGMQWEHIFELGVTQLVVVPSFLNKMLEYAAAHGINPEKSKVRQILAIGESLRDTSLQPNKLLQKISKQWNIPILGTYASTEMQTAFTECSEMHGGHLHTELLIAEVLDENGIPVAAGETGEVTITTLGVEAMPLLRYRTGDMCKMYTEPCACGRKSPRLGPVLGRKQQMLKIKGTTIFPNAVFDILFAAEVVEEFVLEVNTDTYGLDELTILISTRESTDTSRHLLTEQLRQRLRVLPKILFETAENIKRLQFPGDNRKPVRFIDNRNIITQ